MDNLIHGLGNLASGSAIAYLFVGALLGMILGVIPGLSTTVLLSILLVFVFRLDLTATLCLFLGVQCASFYSASVSAILLNMPPHPEAYPITLDGYPMARKGMPGRALGLSACSTFIGGLIGCAILVAFLPILSRFPLIFHPPEYVALVVLAMLLVGTLGTNSVGKAVVAAGIGLMLSSVGPAIITGQFRYTMGEVSLYNGVSIVAVALGIFAIPQMVMVFGTGTVSARQDLTGKEVESTEAVELTEGYGRQLIGGIAETFRRSFVLIQSGIVGGLTGMVPGIGGFAGNYMAYGIARQLTRKEKRDQFGTGIADGIIAPEGSSLAKEAGHIIPLVGLGIPGGAAGALFLSALAIEGVKPGIGFQENYPNVTGEMVWIIALTGLIGTVAGVFISPQIARITKVPGPLIVPFVFVLAVTGAFLTQSTFFTVGELLVFGFLGMGLRRLGYPVGSFILGLVLGPTVETNINLTNTIYPHMSWIAHNPLADAIFLVAIAVLVSSAVQLRQAAKKRRQQEKEDDARTTSESSRNEAARARLGRVAPYPLLALVMSVFLLCAALFFVIYGLQEYDSVTRLMPVVSGIAALIPLAYYLPRDLYRYVIYRKLKVANGAGSGGLEVAAATLAASTPAASTLAAATPAASTPAASTLAAATPAASTPAASTLAAATLAAATPAASTLAAATLAAATEPAVASGLPPIVEKSWRHYGQYRRELAALGLLTGLIIMVWLIGFVWGSTIFMVLYGLTCTQRHLRTGRGRLIFTAAGTTAVLLTVYAMFDLMSLVFIPKIGFFQ